NLAKEASIGTIECFRAWIRVMRMRRSLAAGPALSTRQAAQLVILPGNANNAGAPGAQRSPTMLTVHHLGRSQSERIVWLCEELEIPYALKCYTRDSVTMLAPPDYKALHPIGTAPVISDGDLVLGESGAVVESIIAQYGNTRLALLPIHFVFSTCLY